MARMRARLMMRERCARTKPSGASLVSQAASVPRIEMRARRGAEFDVIAGGFDTQDVVRIEEKG